MPNRRISHGLPHGVPWGGNSPKCLFEFPVCTEVSVPVLSGYYPVLSVPDPVAATVVRHTFPATAGTNDFLTLTAFAGCPDLFKRIPLLRPHTGNKKRHFHSQNSKYHRLATHYTIQEIFRGPHAPRDGKRARGSRRRLVVSDCHRRKKGERPRSPVCNLRIKPAQATIPCRRSACRIFGAIRRKSGIAPSSSSVTQRKPSDSVGSVRTVFSAPSYRKTKRMS